MRLVLSAGHGGKDPGAVNPKLHLREHVESYKIVWELRDVLERAGHQAEFISCFQGLSDKIRNVNTLNAEQPVDLAIEVHFNSAVDATAHGTEVLYQSEKNKELAARMSKSLAFAIGTENRGAVKRTNLGWLKRTAPPALIVEVLFIHNNLEAARILAPDFHVSVAKAITEALRG